MIKLCKHGNHDYCVKCNDEKDIENKNKVKEVRTKLLKVAELLGMVAEKDILNDNDYVRFSITKEGTNESIFFSYSAGYGKGNIEIRGNYPTYRNGEMMGDLWYSAEEVKERQEKNLPMGQFNTVISPRITLSPEKTPEQITKDIQRRFLPDYMDYLKRVEEKVKSHDNYEDRIFSNIEILTGKKPDENMKKTKKISFHFEKIENVTEYNLYVDVKVSENDAKIELDNLTLEETKYILDYIKKNRRLL